MLITKVELENIKSYEQANYEFGPGVTAISGPNGAGKTTILEAIAWALFDHLPYKKEDFLRRGTKKGAVRVSFISVIDGREYTVYRDTGTGYYIHDPITKMRLVEQKSQVAGWLKQHLGVDAGTELKALFTSTIGVPQGTFTVDFAEQPSKRKIGFDKVLRVDEYHRSSDELRSLVRLIESRDADLREEIARVEVEVAALDGLMEEKARHRQAINRVKKELKEAEAERDQTREELNRLDELSQRIERQSRESAALDSRIEEAERRQAVMVEQVNQSRAASEAVARSAEGFAVYNEASARLSQLEPKGVKRDEIKKELSANEREQSRLEGLLEGQREKLRQIDVDRAELERLEPMVGEQVALESRRSELQTILGEATVLKERASEIEKELIYLRKEYAAAVKQIDEAEKIKDEAERVPVLEDERKALETELGESRVQLERIKERTKELRRVRDQIAKLSAEIKTLENELAQGAKAEQTASRLPELEAEDQAAMEEIAHLKASIEREQKLVSQIEGGLCPLLAERCLNMKEGQGLDQFFKLQIGNERQQLKAAETKRKEIQNKLDQARVASKTASALANQRVHFSRFRQELELERKSASRIEAEITGASMREQSLKALSEKLLRVEQELKQAQVARTRYEKLDLLRERLEQLKKEGSEKKQVAEDLQTRLEAISSTNDELRQVEKRLALLEDPRGRSRSLKLNLEKEKEVRDALLELEKRAQAVAFAIKELAVRLEAFEGLDEQIAQERNRRVIAEKDHRTHIENQSLASMLEAREKELALVEGELRAGRARRESNELELKQARGEYDEQVHHRYRSHLEEMLNLIGTLGSEMSAARARLEEIEIEISKLIAAKERMNDLLRQKEICRQVHGMSEFIRDLLKKAGPFITEAHLQSISIESNQLYRDITGNPMVSLRWDFGYEIILEEEGHERPFASLSGGEQMAAALAVRLALLKELSDMRIAFFDEPTTNMDEERRRNLAQQIGRVKDFDQLFVISHDDAFEGFTDQVISVRGPDA